MSELDFVSKLGAAEKAALRILIDLPGQSLDAVGEKLFGLYPWTGVILFQKNIGSAEQVAKFNARLQSVTSERFPEYPLLVSVDQEGGSVSPLEGFLTPSPGSMAMAAAGDDDAVYEMARLNGRELREMGFNVDFAPVVDVNVNPKNPIIGIRAYGEDPRRVGTLGALAIRGYQDAGVLATAKHFPGHGDTAKDSHLDLPVVRADESRLREVEFLPFKMAAEAGVWGMMTAHVIYPAIDDKPATLSKKFLTGILREEMKFDGLIFTDSFAMAAIKEHYSLEQAVRDSVVAGADVLLALGDYESQLETFQILKELIEKKKIPAECVDEPLRRILAFRKRLAKAPAHTTKIEPRAFAKSLHEKSVTIVSGGDSLPLADGAEIFLSPDAAPHLELFRRHFRNARFAGWPWTRKPEGRAWLFLGERRLLAPECEALLAEWNAPWECAVAFGNPYHLAKAGQAKLKLTTYHFNELFVEAVRGVLLDGAPAPGKLPVTLA